jgi:adenylate cyclase
VEGLKRIGRTSLTTLVPVKRPSALNMKAKLLFISCLLFCASAFAQSDIASLWSLLKEARYSDSALIDFRDEFGKQQSSDGLGLDSSEVSLELRKAAEDHHENEMKGLALAYFGYEQRSTNSHDSAVHFFGAALKQFEDNNRLQMGAEMCRMIGLEWQTLSQVDSTVTYLERSLALDRKTGDASVISNRLRLVGGSFVNLGIHGRAAEFLMEALKIVESNSDVQRDSYIYQTLGYLYYLQGDSERAMYYHRRGLEEALLVGDSEKAARAMMRIGDVHNWLDDMDSASYWLHKALSLQEVGTLDGHTAATLNSLGLLAARQGNYEEADHHWTRSLVLREKVNDGPEIALSLISLSYLRNLQGKYRESIDLASRALAMSEQFSFARGLEESTFELYISNLELGRHEDALDMYARHTEIRDSVYRSDNQRALMGREYEMEYQKQALVDSLSFASEKAIQDEELKQQKMVRNGFMGGFVLVALFASIFFVQRNRIGKARERSDELLLNILPEEVADELKVNGSSESRLIENVTVLFTDFKGFTALSEQLTPQELVKDIHECFSAFDLIMEKYGIEKIKTIGDAYMAAGGVPIPNATHAEDVVKAGLEIVHFIREGRAKKAASGKPSFEIRVGIHTGPVVSGVVGIKKFQYDIWGDTVNIASRMESSGEVGRVNISEATYALVSNKFNCSARGKIHAKGKGEIDMYFVDE